MSIYRLGLSLSPKRPRLHPDLHVHVHVMCTCADTCSTLHVAHQHYMNVVDNEAIEYFTVHAALLHLHSNSNLQAANTTLDIKSG